MIQNVHNKGIESESKFLISNYSFENEFVYIIRYFKTVALE